MKADRLGKLARGTLVVGAIGSLILLFLHGRPSVFLLLLFTGWVLAPFVLLAWADRVARGWPPAARRVIHLVMVVVSVGSVVVYAYDVATGYGRAVFFVAVPMVAWLVILISLPAAVLIGRKIREP